MTQRLMTRGNLMKLLVKEAKEYRPKALQSLRHNKHMNDLSSEDFLKLKRNRSLTQKMINALLVDFINAVGVGQCLDLALYTKHLK